MTHTVIPQRQGIADHAAPAGEQSTGPDAGAVAQYSATLLPAVLWLLGTYLFDGGSVPMPLQGAVALVVTGLSARLVRYLRNRG